MEFVLGTPRLIVGMEAVLRHMCEGDAWLAETLCDWEPKEKVRAKIPGPLAYNTRAGFLPYDTTILYEMELISITRGL